MGAKARDPGSRKFGVLPKQLEHGKNPQAKGQTCGNAGTQSQGPLEGGSPATEMGVSPVKKMKGFGVGLGAAALSIVFLSSSVSTATAGAANNSCWNVRPKERGFAKKINSARSGNDLGKLRLDPELSKAARVHTREMVSQEFLHHTASEALKQRVESWSVLGENVGVGSTVDSLHTAFMNSPAHRDNVLYGKFNHVGIGTRVVDERLWVTVIFQAEANPGTPLKMPRC